MKHFQPNGRCGNCQFFRRSIKTKEGVVTEPADCGKGIQAKDCVDEFQPRGKKIKSRKLKRKPWQEAR